MVVRLNKLTTAENLAKYKKKPVPAEEFFKKIAANEHQREFAMSWPPGLQAAIGGILTRNIQRDKPLSVTWAWKPSYDFELSLYECEDTAVSDGGITILIGTRYPLDPHPGSIGKDKNKENPKGKSPGKRKRK